MLAASRNNVDVCFRQYRMIKVVSRQVDFFIRR